MNAKVTRTIAGIVGASTVAVVLGLYFLDFAPGPSKAGSESPAATASPADPLAAQSVELSASEFEQFKVRPVGERAFTIQRETVGSLDFNQEMSVAVFPPAQGKII